MENDSTGFAHDDLGLLGMGEALERAYSERALSDAFERRIAITKKRFGGIVKTNPTKENGEIKNVPDLSSRPDDKESEAASTKATGTTNSAAVPVAPAVRILR